MTASILIAYATRFGSTEQVAEAIADTLRIEGLEVDLQPMQSVTSLDGYRAVLLGSAVNHGHWLPEAVEFVTTHQPALNGLPVALFSVHITNIGDDEKSRKARLAYLDEIRSLLTPVDEVFFPGRFDRRGAKVLLPKWLAWLVPPIELRKWDVIRAWARAIPQKL